MSGIFALLNKLGILSAARRLDWREQASTADVAPSSETDGVPLEQTLFAQFEVLCREQPAYRTTRITFSSFDAASDYDVIVNGNTVAIVDGLNIAATIQAAANAINADGTVGAIVAASAEARNGATLDTLVLRGLAEADYTCTVATTSGTGVITADLDATGAVGKFFSLPSGLNSEPIWAVIPDSEFTVTTANVRDRMRVAGAERIYGRFAFTGGSGRIRFGLGIEE